MCRHSVYPSTRQYAHQQCEAGCFRKHSFEQNVRSRGQVAYIVVSVSLSRWLWSPREWMGLLLVIVNFFGPVCKFPSDSPMQLVIQKRLRSTDLGCRDGSECLWFFWKMGVQFPIPTLNKLSLTPVLEMWYPLLDSSSTCTHVAYICITYR